MTDDFEDSLRETLGLAVPPPPEDPGRAAGARGYSRRAHRTRAVAVVGGVAAVAAAILVIPAVLASSSPDHTASPVVKTPQSLAPLPTPPVAHPFTCAGGGLIHNESPPLGVVASGAVLARLCAVDTGAARWSPPAEALVTDVDGLARTLNALSRIPKGAVYHCPIQTAAQPEYTLTFQYADGHTVSVRGDTGGCSFVTAGTVGRLGGRTLLDDYLNRLHDQRVHYAPPPQATTALSCPATPDEGQAVLVDGRGPGLTRAVACSYELPAGPVTAGTLSAQQVTQLNADLAAHATRSPAETAAVRTCQATRGDRGVLSIVGVDAWGDRIDLSAQCSAFTFTDRDGTWYWTPTSETAAMLDSVLRPTGQVSGRLQTVGGPAPGLPQPVSGRITVQGRGGTQQVAVGPDGRFTLLLAPGRYRIVGHSPSYGGDRYVCQPAKPVTIVSAAGRVRVDVLCQEK